MILSYSSNLRDLMHFGAIQAVLVSSLEKVIEGAKQQLADLQKD